MQLKELNRRLKSFFRGKPYVFVEYPYELVKLRHLDRLSVTIGDVAFCLEKRGTAWVTYLIDRGTTQDEITTFSTEESACEYFYHWVTREQ